MHERKKRSIKVLIVRLLRFIFAYDAAIGMYSYVEVFRCGYVWCW